MPEHDPGDYMKKLYESDPLQRPLLRRIVRSAGLPPESRGLDAGCGVGLQLPLLAEAVGPESRVTGLDILPEFVAEAKSNLIRWGLEGRVSLVRGDIFDLPFRDGHFDWIWSCSCACYAMDRPLELLEGFRRVLRPGGQLLIVIWSGQQLLPGYPRLEALLNATTPGIAPFKAEDRPERHFLRLAGWMRRAGFGETSAVPFTDGICAPLEEETRKALQSLIEMRWLGSEKELEPSDRSRFRRISDPQSADYVLGQPDYYGFYTYTLFRGRAPD